MNKIKVLRAIALIAASIFTILFLTQTYSPVSAENGNNLPPEYIAFNRDGDIWRMDPNHPDMMSQLTFGNTGSFPLWSTDGSQIAYRSGPEGYQYIFVMDKDGSNQRPVWGSSGWAVAYTWYSDDSRLYINTNNGYGWVDPDGPVSQSLHPVTGAEGKGYNVISPDGKHILFTDHGPGNDLLIGEMSDDGNSVKIIRTFVDLPPEMYEISEPVWSRDGSHVAFSMGPVLPNRSCCANIYTVDSIGGNLRQITYFDDINAYSPSWSPGGNWITSASTPLNDIYVAPSDGSFNPVFNLTNSSLAEGQPDWSPIFNYPPNADSGGPYLVRTYSTIMLDGTGFDPDQDPLDYSWSATSGSFNDSSLEDPFYTAGSEAGIFDLTLTVTDSGGLANVDTTFVVVYDPEGGFVTGGGWIYSDPGAYIPDPLLEGKATFGFVSKYKKGAEIPTGNTEFQFHVADLNFHSSSYEWLVVTGSDYAMFKGIGTVNGMGDYKFRIWAGDGDPDTFRIKIWEEDEFGVETVIYDNGVDQEIGGGSIVIHTK